MKSQQSNRKKDRLIKVIWALAFLMIWEGSARAGLVNALLLPAFSDVLSRLIKGLVDGTLLIQYAQSILMIAFGLLICLLMTLIMVYLDYNYRLLRALFELLASIFHPLPGVAILPVVMIWFSTGQSAVMIIIIHAAVWSMYLNLKKGVEGIDVSLIEAAHNNGASKVQLYKHVLIPCAFKDLLTGLQIGWARGWRGLISAEMIYGTISTLGGIGWFMFERRAFMDTIGMYAGIVLVAITGIIVEDLLFDRLLGRWYRSE